MLLNGDMRFMGNLRKTNECSAVNKSKALESVSIQISAKNPFSLKSKVVERAANSFPAFSAEGTIEINRKYGFGFMLSQF